MRRGDPAIQLEAVDQFWPAFRDALPRSARSWANELRGTRNDWVHNKQFSADDAYRVLDTAERREAAGGGVLCFVAGDEPARCGRLIALFAVGRAVAAAWRGGGGDTAVLHMLR